MNTWLSWRPDEQLAQSVRAMLRRGTRMSHYLFSVVGGCAVLLALLLWLMPGWRGTLAARLMPVISAAVQAGPARLLQGHPLPAFGAFGKTLDDSLSAAPVGGIANASYDGAFDGSGAGGAGTAPDVGTLARLIPAQRVAAEARDDRVLVSSREQQLVASYLSRRYRVAQDPVGELVKAAFETGRDVGLDPLLLLAVMAIESGFNPYAESGVGAQGLMQVMSKVHSDKLQYFGGQRAALEPLTNIRVGALVLKDCIARGGSLAGGLRLYVGSSSQDDGGYGAKVMAERGRLRDVAHGVKVPVNAPQAPATTVASVSVTPVALPKRVQATLEGGHALTPQGKAEAESDEEPAKSATQDDPGVSANGTRLGVGV
ncbi:lytic transglycosylase domain-containing protein [Paraburkholderia bonniea]|uniref:lytic transglycosylase domain-containing protein n=1 Tax=Paraburkholderia bonniea TaxID=2152891 RepID=UPI0012914D0D|nr:lytic transglycosylase domain-containing protein [Paraburkholderia bonniea]WJF90914.1 lytic transglycosylase domain-containing protein [Paraburkholderia bonniea]WJF94228.1 lytic transglycosylase domain-containing protein [Paraburkholderia bonniea]